MLIECPDCAARVHGKVLAKREYGPTSEYDPRKYVLLECPSCHEILLGMCDYDIFTAYDGTEQERWSLPKRLWPDPQKSYDFSIPQLVRNSLEDAKKCFEAKVYTACAVMCGRALEAICNEKTGESSLARGLQKLKSTNQIDDRLFNWGEALRKERNVGAHASEETISRPDAQDILDFANAIVEYIYVMTAKFEAYKARKTSKEKI